MSERSRSSATVVKLFCPSLSKLVPFTVASEEEKLDLGAIARTFGLEPGTLKLNGHFISRGVDLVSSSVTWNSLISFFASRGLSTGTSDREALIVDGKLCKPGMKRLHSHSDCEIGGDHQNAECSNDGIKRKSQLDEVNTLKKNKIGDNTGEGRPDDKIEKTTCNDISLKRKSWLEDVNLLKKTRMNTDSSGSEKEPFETISGIQSGCSYTNRSLKRVREDELIMATPCKRTR